MAYFIHFQDISSLVVILYGTNQVINKTKMSSPEQLLYFSMMFPFGFSSQIGLNGQKL